MRGNPKRHRAGCTAVNGEVGAATEADEQALGEPGPSANAREGQREREDADADGKMDVDVSPEPEENMAEDGSAIEDSAGKADPKGNGTGDDVDELEYI